MAVALWPGPPARGTAAAPRAPIERGHHGNTQVNGRTAGLRPIFRHFEDAATCRNRRQPQRMFQAAFMQRQLRHRRRRHCGPQPQLKLAPKAPNSAALQSLRMRISNFIRL